MKRWLGGLMVGALTLGACALAFHQITKIFVHADMYNISFDNLLSLTAQQAVSTFVTKHFNKIQHAALLKTIKKEFPYIQNIAAHQKRPGLIHISIVSAKPWLALNSAHVMTNSGAIVNQSDYATQHLRQLPIIKVPEQFVTDHTMTGTFFLSMQKINPMIFNKFQLAWHSPYHLVLTDVQEPWFCVLTECHNPPSSALIAYCDIVKNNLKNQIASNTHAHKPATHIGMQTWYADLRFAHQIVVSRSQEQVASKPKSVGQEVSVYLVDTQSKLQGISSCETNMKGESHV